MDADVYMQNMRRKKMVNESDNTVVCLLFGVGLLGKLCFI